MGDDALAIENQMLRVQNEKLSARVEELQRELGRRGPQADALTERHDSPGHDMSGHAHDQIPMREAIDWLSTLLASAPVLLFVKDVKGRYLLANRCFLTYAGYQWSQIQGKTDFDLYPVELASSFWSADKHVIDTYQTLEREDSFLMPDGMMHHFVTTKFALRDGTGKLHGLCGLSIDISNYKRAEQENRRLQEEIIRVQEASLQALSTPLLPIARGVVVMPLIGSVDRARAARVLETLLDGIVSYSATKVILDVTGVTVMDSEVANSLIRTAQAAKLIGASVILTGIQPSIAQTLIQIGVDLSGIMNESTLESAITRALRK